MTASKVIFTFSSEIMLLEKYSLFLEMKSPSTFDMPQKLNKF